MRRAMALAVLLLTSVLTTSPPTHASPQSRQAPTTTFYDGFTGPAGAQPSPLNWAHEVGNGIRGWGNHDLEYYTAGAHNSYLDGRGHLVIAARKERMGRCWNGRPCRYTSARLVTRTSFTQTYGHLRARIKLQPRAGAATGFFPAFWALGSNIDAVGFPTCGEIDIMENINADGRIHGFAHASHDQSSQIVDYSATYDLRKHHPRGWHTYGVDWTPTRIRYTVDGHVYGRTTRAHFGTAWQYDHPFYLILNLAVGGEWPGHPTARTRFPMVMKVDYVKATTL